MKFFLTAILSLFVLCLSGQKKKFFFDNAEFSFLLGNDNNRPVYGSDWLNACEPGRVAPYNIDSLERLIPKDRFFLGPINIGPSVKITVAKNFGFSTKRGNGFEWKLAATVNSAPYSDFAYYENNHGNLFTDTTKTYTYQTARFSQQKMYVGFQNAVVYKIRSYLLKWVQYYIGAGINVSFLVNHVINEQFTQNVYKWNTATRSFQSNNNINTQTDSKGVKKNQLQFIIPWGTILTLSKKSRLGLEGYYTLAKNNFTNSTGHKKAEGYWLGLFYRYAINN